MKPFDRATADAVQQVAASITELTAWWARQDGADSLLTNAPRSVVVHEMRHAGIRTYGFTERAGFAVAYREIAR